MGRDSSVDQLKSWHHHAFKSFEHLGYKGGLYILSLGGFFYIGSSNDMERRLIEHLRDLEAGRHHNRKMQDLFDDGEIVDFTPIMSLLDHELLDMEQSYLDAYAHRSDCINVCADVGAPMTGRTHSEATRAQMSASHSRRVSVTIEKTFPSRMAAAEHFGVHPTTVSRWINGTISPPAKHCIASIS